MNLIFNGTRTFNAIIDDNIELLWNGKIFSREDYKTVSTDGRHYYIANNFDNAVDSFYEDDNIYYQDEDGIEWAYLHNPDNGAKYNVRAKVVKKQYNRIGD